MGFEGHTTLGIGAFLMLSDFSEAMNLVVFESPSGHRSGGRK